VCIATSGPGATNLITGVACAYDNNVPMLVITGQPPIKNFGKGALQEGSCTGINTMAMFRPCTRYNSLVSHAEQLPTKLFNALMQAQRAPSGPSHLSIPVDILRAPVSSDVETPDFAGLLRRAPALVDLPAVRQLAPAVLGAPARLADRRRLRRGGQRLDATGAAHRWQLHHDARRQGLRQPAPPALSRRVRLRRP
jgi:acetolactate synthase-1/2/3 large subunit